MGKFFTYFWVVFIMYFIFAHPAIIYYSTVSYSDLANVNGKTSLIYLGISLLLWISVFGITFYLIYKSSFLTQKNIAYLLRYGKRVEAKIIEAKTAVLQNKKFAHKKLVLELKNFNRDTILHSLEINDSRPQENRYEEGNWITLIIDENFKKAPYITLDGIKTKVNYSLYFIWLFFLAAIISYYVYSYKTENFGYGWRFLSFEHPLIISPLVIFFIGFIFWLIFVKLMGKFSFRNKSSLELKFKGQKTIAKIISAEQTGTYINNQPQVKFELTYTDISGKIHHNSIKKIVSLMEIGNLQQKEKEIFYLIDDPNTIAFTDDLYEI
ncbi:hypothetical protein SAMN05443634_110136 [Chishuiella changwenlii]|uniref:Uncharacterized protein n=2 Tax=Chishuiella changwenlii TaxID=1434701 RepID=A0A1M7BDE6_9FLAO|nr:hypothetical protein [Chishuiella changwenlii]SHL52951.1 hypothetical protein SAMN05443634_110136 [Chishuiella changwenlii]